MFSAQKKEKSEGEKGGEKEVEDRFLPAGERQPGEEKEREPRGGEHAKKGREHERKGREARAGDGEQPGQTEKAVERLAEDHGKEIPLDPRARQKKPHEKNAEGSVPDIDRHRPELLPETL